MTSANTGVVPSTSLPPLADRLLKIDQVMDIVSLGKTMIYRLVGDDRFPQPFKPGGHASRWSEREIYEWLAGCGSERMCIRERLSVSATR